ncbi:MAG: alpha/beta hydrolase [Anaerolineae bacterium]|nr:alpha/beta hydrolase [Anaerolineae bacterium]
MAAWQTADIPVDGLSIHYVRTGGDRSPLVMAHGHSDHGLCWTRVAKALEADYDLIMYDARGHGLSGDGDVPGSREVMAHDAAGLIKALGLVRPGLMGHSMGAATAAITAALYPEAVSYIILEDPPWFDPETRDQRHRNRDRRQAPEPQTRDGWLALYRERYADPHVDDMIPWAEAQMQFRQHRRYPRSPDARPWQEFAAQITCPALLITGDPEKGSIVTAQVAAEALRLMPRAELAHIAGAGHTVRRTQFDAYMVALRAFLARR